MSKLYMSTVYSLKLKEAIFLQKSETQFKHANSTFYHLFILVFALSGVLQCQTLRSRSIGISHFNQNRIWLKQLRFRNRTLFNRFWLTCTSDWT